LVLAFVYSIFLPLRLGTIWFYIGLPIALVGVVTYAMVIVSFATNPIGKEPVTTGLYRYSRHPMYITQLVMFIGVGIASASWLFLLLTIVYRAPSLIYVGSEEHICVEKYGDAYRQYMERTPKMDRIAEILATCYYFLKELKDGC
jgi:protein-S-isoprenylcysteine O-methyltransferase Ste14